MITTQLKGSQATRLTKPLWRGICQTEPYLQATHVNFLRGDSTLISGTQNSCVRTLSKESALNVKGASSQPGTECDFFLRSHKKAGTFSQEFASPSQFLVVAGSLSCVLNAPGMCARLIWRRFYIVLEPALFTNKIAKS